MIYTEPGGRMEAELARYVTEESTRKLPIVAFMAGRFMDEMPGMSFGHAGTIVEGKEDTAAEKIERLAVRRDRGGGGDRRDPGPGQGAAWEWRREERRHVHRRGGGRLRGRRRRAREEASRRRARWTSTPPARAAWTSWRRTSTSASCAACAWTPSPHDTVKVIKLYDNDALFWHAF